MLGSRIFSVVASLQFGLLERITFPQSYHGIVSLKIEVDPYISLKCLIGASDATIDCEPNEQIVTGM